MWYSNQEKTFISRHVLHQHWYTCPIALPMRRNPQHRSLLTVISATSAPRFQPVISETFATKAELLYPTNTSHRKQETFLYEYSLHWVLLPTKKRRTTERCSSVIHSSSTVAILTTETSLLDCYEDGLCCYLVIHIENLLRPLQLFYFHLWPIYRLSLVHHCQHPSESTNR
jgi:hypothetical protein